MNRDIQEAARRYLGVPFVHQGRTARGLDCVGLLVRVAEDLGFQARDFTAYSLRPSSRLLMRLIADSCDRVDSAEPGDILVFSMIGPGWPQHAGIKTDKGMIHAMRGGPDKVVEHVLDDMWTRKLDSVWRYRWQH
jgi:cell wall-associated NlpC family hydrolase